MSLLIPRKKLCSTQASLKRLGNKGVVRVGATTKPSSRCASYQSEGYHGTMSVARTKNMRAAENKLLKRKNHVHNVHCSSNVPAKPGYVYKIKGQKRKK